MATMFVLLAMLFRANIAAPFLMSGDSMSPTYRSGEYFFIENWNKTAQKGDIVIFKYSIDGTTGYNVRRVAGVAGDSVNGVLVPNGSYYVTSDGSSTVLTGLISASDVIGKPIMKVGQISVK